MLRSLLNLEVRIASLSLRNQQSKLSSQNNIMSSSVFVGNISWNASEDQVRDLLSQAGDLRDFRMICDRETGRPRGFGFAEFGDPASAKQAIQQLNGYEVDGRPLKVNESQGR